MFLKFHTVEISKLIGEPPKGTVIYVRASLIRSVAEADVSDRRYGINSVISYGDLSTQYHQVQETVENIIGEIYSCR